MKNLIIQLILILTELCYISIGYGKITLGRYQQDLGILLQTETSSTGLPSTWLSAATAVPLIPQLLLLL
jgi:hypothetical protein